MVTNQQLKRCMSSGIVALAILVAHCTEAFVPSAPRLASNSLETSHVAPSVMDVAVRKKETKLEMFMGSDGGILGVGTPEIFTILLVGYFVLGPSDLYKVTKEIGKFVQNFRTFSADATATLETNLESQLQLDEIRKAQRDLNEAFSFRRSINVDSDSEAFEVNAKSPRLEAPEPLAASPSDETGTGTPKKKIRRRRVKKKKVEEEQPFSMENIDSDITPNVPDLDMDAEMMESEERMMASLTGANEELRNEQMEDEAAQLRRERMERLQGGDAESEMAEKEMAAEGYDVPAMSDSTAQNRFQAQLSENWNEQIIAKEDELGPVADIMKRLAILEEEKIAADKRLQEEFKLREENEERFYREKRQLLEDAGAQLQTDAFATTGPSSSPNNSAQQ
mmetsp:Transcript_43777/g.105590  ORF Transcript_43777/g.105590 Transcript_43777/m.105590 type:complete len:394 (-) Transcript_43777:103-1284(-)|eukprot:CAMPEP_0113647506 /NCGR_PEP_ID=MMETSP0017_2-20120614/25150_1 /TAXON_ID=2856 /ORGANISM="Cylindrotheca closterium" /LENGTH=393 /DNA_ID=CAMNT_0000559573 /DNA_START=33 /DNA_END=1214 /DNA_ORIENTATION=- /assembly_acc=CAM_ASM_000147